jgi:AcrR family transcriptional regulator
MAEKKARLEESEAATHGLARLVPTQKRSRERFERILECAVEIMIEKGSDALRMSDIVERAGVPFGSLYQYFPDKTAIIGTLAERYDAMGRVCVETELAQVHKAKDLHPALCRIVDGYYRMFIDEPVMRDIWNAMQVDRALQKQDEAEGEYLAGILLGALKRIAPHQDEKTLAALSQMTMILIAAAVRHAITLPPEDADRVINLFKRMLPNNLSGLA